MSRSVHLHNKFTVAAFPKARFPFSTIRPVITVKNIIQRNPIIMKRKSEFEHIYSLYEYEALAKEQSRGFVLMPTADSLQKPKSAAEIELIISKQNEFDRLHAERVIEHDSNLTSLNRKPSEKLYLLVKIPGALNWQFPFKRTTEEETEVPLYKISEGNFADIVGGACEYYHVARTPIASSQSPNEYILPPALCQFPKEKILDVAWFTKQEMSRHLLASDYEAIKDALLD